MLYDAYQAQNDIFGPIRLIAGTASQWLGHSWLPMGDMPFMRGAAAAMELLSHAGMSHERPDFRIERVTIDGREIAVHEEIAASHPFCNLVHFRKDLARDEPTVLGRRSAVRPFRYAVAGHGRDLAYRPQCLPDRLGQCARRAAIVRPLRPGRFCRVGHSFCPRARPPHSCRGGVPALGSGAGGSRRCWPPTATRANLPRWF